MELDPILRLKAVIRGAVQGVGFRPFIYRLATKLQLKGWVMNTSHGVVLEVEGRRELLEEFLERLDREKPAIASLQSLEPSFLDSKGYDQFEIRESDEQREPTALILPDIATCPDCLAEILDPANRRNLYPFTNCTNCGPRFSILESLPYDRSGTTMRNFEMCPACQREYDDPGNRRFHAQPNACPDCGPRLELWDGEGRTLALRHEALIAAAQAVQKGKILALKGLGGFHLICDARDEAAVRRLRERKFREEKPFAVMVPSFLQAKQICEISGLEERLLNSPEAPIVLLKRREGILLASAVAPGNPQVGVLLPYTPLHHLLMLELGFPVIATSGNLTDEPLAIDEREALKRLKGIADIFLVHDRPISRRVDDSVTRVVLGREQVLRRSRGYAPLPVRLSREMPRALAVGAHLKNTVAFALKQNAFLSQHIGDLENLSAQQAFRSVIDDFKNLYRFHPSLVVCDEHPDYASTQYARETGSPLLRVQHHVAHALACAAENEVEPPYLGVIWDGTGWGPDGTIWGGEFLRIDPQNWTRLGHLRLFRLPGGEKAIREPRRSAWGLLYEIKGKETAELFSLPSIAEFSSEERGLLLKILAQNVNAPRTSSVGRLFDGVASILGLRQQVHFEGQAAMELEFAAGEGEAQPYEAPLLKGEGGWIFDWQPLIMGILADRDSGRPVPEIARKFHETLALAVVEMAKKAKLPKVVLSGGCFQNRLLTERTIARLREKGFQPYWHQRVPPGDGGIALGQLVEAGRQSRESNSEGSKNG